MPQIERKRSQKKSQGETLIIKPVFEVKEKKKQNVKIHMPFYRKQAKENSNKKRKNTKSPENTEINPWALAKESEINTPENEKELGKIQSISKQKTFDQMPYENIVKPEEKQIQQPQQKVEVEQVEKINDVKKNYLSPNKEMRSKVVNKNYKFNVEDA